ncbi:Gfo/Idh/MocA family protein [Pseudomonas chlororaphis]|uniref:Gfo/Idh/MocA family protein n=1 Tax=Pseudomonas chlororaphis TaxID=587753 RepID=UPI003BA1EF9C
MNIGIVGCGYVADLYTSTISNHPSLRLIGVCDVNETRARTLAERRGAWMSTDMIAFVRRPEVEMIVNLTPPEHHSAVTSEAIRHSKPCYSEKPFATSFIEGRSLVELARQANVPLASAPCSMLGEAAQTAWRAIRQGIIGTPRLVYANLDDGAVHRMAYDRWVTPRGLPWPHENEFRHGCVIEHAMYHLTWLVMMFGPVTSGTSFATPLWNAKCPSDQVASPDISVAVLRHTSGVVSRVTCGVAARRDRSFLVVGDDGELHVSDCWNFMSPVNVLRIRAEIPPGREASSAYLSDPEELMMARAPNFSHKCGDANDMDYCRGIAEFTDAIQNGRPSRLGPAFSLHCLEVQDHMNRPGPHTFSTTTWAQLPELIPMPWAN